MKVVTMKGEARESGGTPVARRLRRAGRLPAVVYGDGAPEHVSLDMHTFRHALDGGARLVDMDTGAGPKRVLLKEVQYDALGIHVLHADFLRLRADRPIELAIPLEIEGVSKGQAEGGVLTVLRSTVSVRCLPGNIPENVPFSIVPLVLGQTVYGRDLELPEGVELAQDPGAAVLTIAIPRGVEADEETPAEGEEGAEGVEGAEGGEAAKKDGE